MKPTKSKTMTRPGALCAVATAVLFGGCAVMDAATDEERPAGARDREADSARGGEPAARGTATFALGEVALISLPFEQVGPYQVFEDDIVLNVPRPGTAELSVIPTNVARRWPDGVIPYTIDPSLHDDLRPRIQDAIAEWHARTNIRLVARTSQTNYVTFTRPDSEVCQSNIGMLGGQQFIWLSLTRCNVARIIHEIGHTVGMWHEHSRSDRDSHIVIHWDNIESGKRDNFYKISQYLCTDRNTGGAMQCPETHVTEYDINSRMHYHSQNFSANGQPTITRRFDGGTIPMVAALSPTDAAAVRALYAPVPGPGASTPLWRYYNGTNTDHFYTITRNDAGYEAFGYGFETSEGGVFAAQHNGTVPIYQFWNAGIGDHFYTTNPFELGNGPHGYTFEVVAGYLFPVQFKGTVPLYRYWNGTDHYYTKTFAPGAYGYQYEGVLGYVY